MPSRTLREEWARKERARLEGPATAEPEVVVEEEEEEEEVVEEVVVESVDDEAEV